MTTHLEENYSIRKNNETSFYSGLLGFRLCPSPGFYRMKPFRNWICGEGVGNTYRSVLATGDNRKMYKKL
jgi:hypothetical protein